MNKWRESIFSKSLVVILSFAMIQQVYSFSANAGISTKFTQVESLNTLVLDSNEIDASNRAVPTSQSDPFDDNFPEQQDNESEEESCEEDDLKLLLSFLKPSYSIAINLKSFVDRDLSSLASRLGKIPTPPPEV
tara:strand:- start:2806 stop:3207 length:402 start_codon:yes stop_codon:yes gene_type:complete